MSRATVTSLLHVKSCPKLTMASPGIEAYALPDVPVVIHKSTGLVPAYKVVPAVGAACALAWAFYEWDKRAFADRLPHTMSPVWKVMEMRRYFCAEREAGPPVVLNPFRNPSLPLVVLHYSINVALFLHESAAGLVPHTPPRRAESWLTMTVD